MTTVLWVRHGESQAEVDGCFSHRRVDPSLTGDGILQSRQVATQLQGRPLHALYSSPLKRALETADFVSKRTTLPIIPLESFRDINVGELEERASGPAESALYEKILESWLADDRARRFPGGEDLYMLLGRLGEGLAHVFTRHPEGQVVIVGHAMQLVVAMRSICPAADTHHLLHSPMGFCTISEIALDRQDGRIRGRLLSWGGGKAGG